MTMILALITITLLGLTFAVLAGKILVVLVLLALLVCLIRGAEAMGLERWHTEDVAATLMPVLLVLGVLYLGSIFLSVLHPLISAMPQSQVVSR